MSEIIENQFRDINSYFRHKILSMNNHFEKLIRMYNSGAINKLYQPTLTISHGKAEIRQEVNPQFFHAANALHGSVYFKVLDDASFFAANSLVKDVFVVTANFNIQLIRPITSGFITGKATVVSNGFNLIFTRADLFNERGKLVASGTGNFMKSTTLLSKEIGYR